MGRGVQDLLPGGGDGAHDHLPISRLHLPRSPYVSPYLGQVVAMVLTIISFAVGVGNVEGFIISEIMPVYAKVRRTGHG